MSEQPPPEEVDSPARIRVLVVDDHALFRRGLRMLLEQEHLHVVGEAGTGTEAVQQAVESSPDVVLMDVRMPRGDGIEACAAVPAALPQAKIVMMTSSDEEADLFEAVTAGATGYLFKDSPVEQIASAVRLVHGGQHLITPSMISGLTSSLAPATEAEAVESPGPLTQRERQVLALVGQGLGNRDIAKRLFISEHTAKNHLRHILDKLHLGSRVEAAVYAMREGIVDA